MMFSLGFLFLYQDTIITAIMFSLLLFYDSITRALVLFYDSITRTFTGMCHLYVIYRFMLMVGSTATALFMILYQGHLWDFGLAFCLSVL